MRIVVLAMVAIKIILMLLILVEQQHLAFVMVKMVITVMLFLMLHGILVKQKVQTNLDAMTVTILVYYALLKKKKPQTASAKMHAALMPRAMKVMIIPAALVPLVIAILHANLAMRLTLVKMLVTVKAEAMEKIVIHL